MMAAAATMLVLIIPVILIFVGRPPGRAGIAAELAAADAPSASRIRAQAFRDVAFLTVSIAFALVLFAQVGFIVHLISFLDPVIGRERAAIAVAMLTAMAMVGRVLFSTVIDRLNQRLASAISFASQAVALAIIINSRNEMVLIAACALFGFSVGNLITLPALIVQREFDPRSFGVLISLITAINQITYAFGPGIIGLLRDASGSYALPFYGCIGLELTAAVLIMIRRRSNKNLILRSARMRASRSDGAIFFCMVRDCASAAPHHEGYASRCRSRSSRSSRRVNIASVPSGVRGHCSLGRSQYSSTPFSSGSRKYKRFADAVIAGAIELDSRLNHPIQRIGQRRAGRIENRGVKQPGGARRRRMAAFAFPGVQSDMVVIAAGRNERRAGTHSLHDLEAEHAAIESQRAIEIGDLEMNMPDARSRDDGRGGL